MRLHATDSAEAIAHKARNLFRNPSLAYTPNTISPPRASTSIVDPGKNLPASNSFDSGFSTRCRSALGRTRAVNSRIEPSFAEGVKVSSRQWSLQCAQLHALVNPTQRQHRRRRTCRRNPSVI